MMQEDTILPIVSHFCSVSQLVEQADICCNVPAKGRKEDDHKLVD